MKKILFLLIAILLPFTYDMILKGAYIFTEVVLQLDTTQIGPFFFDSVTCAIMTVFYFIWYMIIRKKLGPPKTEGKRKALVKYIPNWIIYTVVTFGMGQIASIWFTLADILATQNETISNSFESFESTWSNLDSEPYIFIFLSVVFLGPLVEELLFRGLMYNYLERVGGVWFAIIISGVAFGAWHLEPVQVVYTAFMGIIIAIVYRYSKSIWVVFYIHMLNNLLTTLPEFAYQDVAYEVIEYISKLSFIPMIICLILMIKVILEEIQASKKKKDDTDSFFAQNI